MTSTTIVRPADPTLHAALRLALVFAAAKLLLHFALTLWTEHLGYRYFRDEFYYIACGRHLAWGYVDHGPVVALQARVGEVLFGDSVFGIRVLSALAGSLMVFFCGVVTWALGGKRAAQALAMTGLIVAPCFLGTDSYLSMNSFEPVFWTACVLALLLMQRGESQRLLWIAFGVSAGIGLLNKPSMAIFLLALGAGLLCTPQRRLLFSRDALLGIALLVLLGSPYLLWQMTHQWAMLEFLRNGKLDGKNVVLGPLPFFIEQWGMVHPLNSLLWITGVVALLRARSIQGSRWLGITYLFFFAAMFAAHAKNYYLIPVYPSFFAAGAVAWEHRFSKSASVATQRIFAFPVFQSLLILTGIYLLPLSLPVFAPATWLRYTRVTHLRPTSTEKESSGSLPQFYADRFIWDEQVSAVLGARRSLTPAEQSRVCLFGKDYGDAGAIDFLGHMQEPRLPAAISGHNNYWLWGMHSCDPNLVIAIISDKPEQVAAKYEVVQPIPFADNPWAMPFERHRHIYLLRNRRPDAPFHWEDERFYY